MKHAGANSLVLAPLLEKLRALPALREKRPGVFYLESRAFLHFHEDPSGVFADVRLGTNFTRLPATSKAQQADLLDQIDEHLSAIISRSSKPGRAR